MPGTISAMTAKTRPGMTEMSDQKGCKWCFGSDPERKKDDKIRCRVFSEWREPCDDVCSSYLERESAERLLKIKKEKLGSLYSQKTDERIFLK